MPAGGVNRKQKKPERFLLRLFGCDGRLAGVFKFLRRRGTWISPWPHQQAAIFSRSFGGHMENIRGRPWTVGPRLLIIRLSRILGGRVVCDKDLTGQILRGEILAGQIVCDKGLGGEILARKVLAGQVVRDKSLRICRRVSGLRGCVIRIVQSRRPTGRGTGGRRLSRNIPVGKE